MFKTVFNYSGMQPNNYFIDNEESAGFKPATEIIKPNNIWFHHIFIGKPFLNKPIRRSRKILKPVLHPVIMIVYY